MSAARAQREARREGDRGPMLDHLTDQHLDEVAQRARMRANLRDDLARYLDDVRSNGATISGVVDFAVYTAGAERFAHSLEHLDHAARLLERMREAVKRAHYASDSIAAPEVSA